METIRVRYAPAAQVIALLGGVRPLARALGINAATISRWQSDGPRGGRGLIPAEYQGPILRLAQERGLELGPQDVVQL
jgi:hypothetical protein